MQTHIEAYVLERKTSEKVLYVVCVIPGENQHKPLWLGIINTNKCTWFNIDEKPTKFPATKQLYKFLRLFGMNDSETITIDPYNNIPNRGQVVFVGLTEAAKQAGWTLRSIDEIPDAEAVDVPYLGIYAVSKNIRCEKRIDVLPNEPRSREHWKVVERKIDRDFPSRGA